MRRAQHIHVERSEERRVGRRDARALQKARKVWMRDDVLDDRIPACGVGVRAAIAEGALSDSLDVEGEVAFLFVEEALAVCDQVLHVTKLRPVDRRKGDLGD